MYLDLENEDYKIIMCTLFDKKGIVNNISLILSPMVIILDRAVSPFYRLKNKTQVSETLKDSFKVMDYMRALLVSSH